MAHECPDCGMQCHCNGDIDDCCHNFPKHQANCDHCYCDDCGEQPCVCFYDDDDDYEY